MKVSAESITPSVTAPDRSWVAVFADLVKARLTFLVLLTSSVGFYLGSAAPVDFPLMFHMLTGTGLIACGAAALNQYLEREWDAKMRRTRERPLPSGQLQPETVLALGAAASVLGLTYLVWLVNPLTAGLGAVTLGTYLWVYTPLKRATWLNTIVGAVPGALPPLMGWVAARNAMTLDGASLFAIQFLWQVPHFLAIAWLYREDYAAAGFRMLSGEDTSGKRTGRCAVIYAILLLVASLAPVFYGLAGGIYLGGAVILGLGFTGTAVQFSRTLTRRHSRQLFLASIVYLPVLFGLLVLDKVKM